MNYEYTGAAADLHDAVTQAAAAWDHPQPGTDVSQGETFTQHWDLAVSLGWTTILDEVELADEQGRELLEAAGAAVSALARAGAKLPVRQTLLARSAAREAFDSAAVAVLYDGTGLWEPVAAFVVTPNGELRTQIPGRAQDLDIAGRPLATPVPRPVQLAGRQSVISNYLLLHEITGAVDGAVDLTRTYVDQRIQFGRPLSSIPAVKTTLGELSVAQGQLHAALREVGRRLPETNTTLERLHFALASAREIAAVTAGFVASTTHQLHGAMGITAESGLHHRTTLLWADRDEGRTGADPSALTEAQLWELTAPGVAS
ncbi:acyl-CoA dehydrogenase family protein [Nocardia sp. NPDC020380]|uniref:acyl-CoA dehydrogenase family protein n=1 Tax=Nocardia sp. NPDC020380 TaxID=3364309 RepID=UPI0037982B71